MQKAIEFKDVNFSFDHELALQNVSLCIESNDFVGIIGPNGGGKTTLLKLIMGFLEPNSGSIEVLGNDPTKNRAKIGYVPQNTPFDKNFPITVLDLVLTGAVKNSRWFGRYPKPIKEKAREIIATLELSDHEMKSYGELSGGLAQRALIARALIDDPEILLLDEPTANVDHAARMKIFDIIFSLKGKKTILMVTHDLDTVITNIERIFCVEKKISTLLPKEVCEHFALGLYHAPLQGEGNA